MEAEAVAVAVASPLSGKIFPDDTSAAAEIGQGLLALTGAPRAAVFLRAIDGRVTCPWYQNLSDGYLRELVTPSNVNPWTHLMRYPELACMDMPKGGRKYKPAPNHLPKTAGLPVAAARRFIQEGVAAVSTWPLVRGGQLIGAMACYYDTPHAPTADDDAAVLDFAAQAVAAAPPSAPPARPNSLSPRVVDGTTAVWSDRAAQPNMAVTPAAAQWVHDHTALTESYERLEALERDLAAKQTQLVLQRAALEAESRRVATEAARLAAERRTLDATRARLERPEASRQSFVSVVSARHVVNSVPAIVRRGLTVATA
ncbi:MAG TPA: GAF domain-containing protein [bacterium]|nr:GAF domain-containing protein [bacterium]